MSANTKSTFRRVSAVFVQIASYTEKPARLFLDQYTLVLDQFHQDLPPPRLFLERYTGYF